MSYFTNIEFQNVNKAFVYITECNPSLSKPLSNIINKSVETGIYPKKLKHAKIIPVFKSMDETDPSNYRSI